jgi:DeoR family transcriptional regulator, fructose operon transcriptional repressor
MNPLCSEEENPRTNANCPALPGKRHRELLRLLCVRDQMTIREVASHFKVSVDTARRDLDLLASQGLLTRTYGGAVAIQQTEPQRGKPLPEMTTRLLTEKRLARLLHQVIKDGETLLLNGGPATRCWAQELGSRDLNIVTNHLDLPFDSVAVARVYILGGRCLRDAPVTVGPMIISGMNISVDCAVIGVDGIAVKEGLFKNNPEEALITAQMIAAAQRTIVVADSSLFAQKSFTRIGPLGSMQVLITDNEPPTDLALALDEAGVEVIIGPQEVVRSTPLQNGFPNRSNGVESAYAPFPPLPDNVIATTTKPNGTNNRIGLGLAGP